MKSVPSIRHPQVSVSVGDLLFVYLSLSVYLQTCIKISLPLPPHASQNVNVNYNSSNTFLLIPHHRYRRYRIQHTTYCIQYRNTTYRIQYRIPHTASNTTYRIPHNTTIPQTAVFDMVRYGMRYGITLLQIAVI